MIIQEWPLSALSVHPKQAIFGDIDEVAFMALVTSIANEGLQTPILITASGSIVAGHQRYRAHQHLGKATILVRVIEGDGQREFFTSNLCSRSLGPLARARAIEGLLTVERNSKRIRRSSEGELRARVGKLIGISGRSVSRLVQLLRLPIPIQHAIDAGLPQSVGLKIERLPRKIQESIAARIGAGEKANMVVREVLAGSQPDSIASDEIDTADDLYLALVDFLADNIDVLDVPENLSTKTLVTTPSDPALLQRAAKFLDRTSQLAQQALDDATERTENLLEGVLKLKAQYRPSKSDNMSQVGT